MPDPVQTLSLRPWLTLLAVFGLVLMVNPMFSLGFLGCISFLALKEYFSMIPTRRVDRRVLFWVYLSIPAQYYFAAVGWYGMFVIFIPVYMFLLIPFRMILNGDSKHFLQSIGSIQWGLMTAVYCLSHASFVLGMTVDAPLPVGNQGLLVFLILLTQINLVCSTLCKTKMVIIAGMVCTIIASCLISGYLTPFSLFHAALIGLLISAAGFIGDMTITAVKRDLGVTQRGLLDRVNSLTFTAPLYFHFLNYYY